METLNIEFRLVHKEENEETRQSFVVKQLAALVARVGDGCPVRCIRRGVDVAHCRLAPNVPRPIGSLNCVDSIPSSASRAWEVQRLDTVGVIIYLECNGNVRGHGQVLNNLAVYSGAPKIFNDSARS